MRAKLVIVTPAAVCWNPAWLARCKTSGVRVGPTCDGCNGDGTRAFHAPASDEVVEAIVDGLRVGYVLTDPRLSESRRAEHGRFRAALDALGVEL